MLIPLLETEELVSKLQTSCILSTANILSHVLDIGAGTGAIGLALLSQLQYAKCTAIDISEVAVSLANRNAKRLQLHPRYNCTHAAVQEFNPKFVASVD